MQYTDLYDGILVINTQIGGSPSCATASDPFCCSSLLSNYGVPVAHFKTQTAFGRVCGGAIDPMHSTRYVPVLHTYRLSEDLSTVRPRTTMPAMSGIDPWVNGSNPSLVNSTGN